MTSVTVHPSLAGRTMQHVDGDEHIVRAERRLVHDGAPARERRCRGFDALTDLPVLEIDRAPRPESARAPPHRRDCPGRRWPEGPDRPRAPARCARARSTRAADGTEAPRCSGTWRGRRPADASRRLRRVDRPHTSTCTDAERGTRGGGTGNVRRRKNPLRSDPCRSRSLAPVDIAHAPQQDNGGSGSETTDVATE